MGTKYTTQTASGYNASPPSDDGTAVATNEVKWSFVKTKIGDPVHDQADAIDTALLTHFDESVLDNTGALTTTAAHHKRTINQTNSGTISLGDAGTMAAGYIVTIKNSHSAANTVDLATGADTLDGTAAGSISLAPDAAMTFVTNAAADGYYQLLGSIANILNESADHAATPTAGKGEIWVRSDAPNALIFTDDAGTDHPLSGQFAIKASDESVDTSTTLQDDDDLQVTLEADSVYRIETYVEFVSTSATPGVKWQWTEADGTYTGVQTNENTPGSSLTEAYIDESTVAAGSGLSANVVLIAIGNFLVRSAGAGGVFKLQWAQNISNATATTCKAGSWMKATKLA